MFSFLKKKKINQEVNQMENEKEKEQTETPAAKEGNEEEVAKTPAEPAPPVKTEEPPAEEEKTEDNGESMNAEAVKEAITDALKPLIERLNALEIKVEKSAQAPVPATKPEAESLNKIAGIYEN